MTGTTSPKPADPIIIKKYANRRLYNTDSSSYVTLEDLCKMVKKDVEFKVVDATSGKDITRSVLTQIIVEEEAKGTNLLPISFLRQLIGFYGDNMQSVVPKYLESTMAFFSQNQEQLQSYMHNTMGDMFPFNQIEKMGQQNLEMLDQAMKMFNPFANFSGKSAPAEEEENLSDLKAQMKKMQSEIESLKKKS